MAKRKRITTENTIRRKTAEKRGLGRFDEYTPWLKIQEVTPPGLVTRILGWKTARVHHLFSRLELEYFFVAEWSKEIIDIREQFPLDDEETIAIAENLNIKHPRDKVSNITETLTTTFCLSVQKHFGVREIARTVVHSEGLNNRKNIEKFEIERRYWKLRNIDWGIVTEKEINSVLTKNIAWIHSFINPEDLAPLNVTLIRQSENIMLPALKKGTIPLREITNNCEKKLNLAPGCGLSVIRHLIAVRRLNVNMNDQIIQPERPLLLSK